MAAEPLSVSAAIATAKAAMDTLPSMVVLGEVSGFRGPARSGHCYFQLKDASASFDVVIWKGIYEASGVELRDGLQLLLTGNFRVYEQRGSLSFNVRHIELSGEGLLRQQVAALARKLQAEGLMDDARKRPIPKFCERVAVVTSPTGSVIDDVKRTLARRNPLVELLVSPCAVQGDDAPPQIIAALARAAAASPDAILLVRGGGSYEDLMTFNDEALARAVANCPVPVISGIGHEPDTTICDFVSDRRASTPTAAAESVAPALDEILMAYQSRRERLSTCIAQQLESLGHELRVCADRSQRAIEQQISLAAVRIDALSGHRCLHDPFAGLLDRSEQLMLSEERLHASMPRLLERAGTQLCECEARFVAAGPRQLKQHTSSLAQNNLRLTSAGQRLLTPFESGLSRAAAALDALSPLKVLSRGYAIVHDSSGGVVGEATALAPGDAIHVRLAAGTLEAEVTKVIDQDSAS